MLCKFNKTIYKNEENGYMVMLYSTYDKTIPPLAKTNKHGNNIEFKAVGHQLPDTNDIEYELNGNWEVDKHGMQFKVESFSEIIPKTKEGIICYLSSGLIKGIGRKTAETIVNRFGDKTFDILEHSPRDLLNIKGITEKNLSIIIDSYEENKATRDIITFLSPYGVSVKKAKDIYNAFASDSLKILKTDPFRLCSLSGFGYKTVDRIARNTACKPNDPKRVQYAVKYLLSTTVPEQGHLYFQKKKLLDTAYKLLNDDYTEEIISMEDVQKEIEGMIKNKTVSSYHDNIYDRDLAIAETTTALKIVTLLIQSIEKLDIEDKITNVQKDTSIELSEQQIIAVRTCFENRLSIIIAVLYNTGIRIGENCALWWEDLNFVTDKISISKAITLEYDIDKDGNLGKSHTTITAPKTTTGNRIIDMNPSLKQILLQWRSLYCEKYRCSYSDITFGKRLVFPNKSGDLRAYGGLRKQFNRFLDQHCLAQYGVTFHRFRHTFATILIEEGVDPVTVQELLGHSNVKVTLQYYVSPTKKSKNKAKQIISESYQQLINRQKIGNDEVFGNKYD